MTENVKYLDTGVFGDDFGKSDRRERGDRRSVSFRSALCSIYKRRRQTLQRVDDQAQPHYIDIYDLKLFSVIMLIIVLCVADAYFTLIILSKGGVELNPFMEWLLMMGPKPFFFGKYFITSAALCLAVLHANFFFLKRIRVRSILSVLSFMYVALILYELKLVGLTG